MWVWVWMRVSVYGRAWVWGVGVGLDAGAPRSIDRCSTDLSTVVRNASLVGPLQPKFGDAAHKTVQGDLSRVSSKIYEP